jgi:acetyl esterase
VPRYPSVLLACLAIQFREWRQGRPTIEARRANAPSGPAPLGDLGDGIVVSEHAVPIDGGTVGVRIHSGVGPGPQPAHLLMHGGSFCYGAARELDDVAARYARTVGCTVVAVDYRLAPEHPYPTAVEDAYAALCWTVAHAEELGVDATRVSIGGLSAGGGIAAAATLMARDREGPRPIFQLLEIPVLDLTGSSPSHKRYGRGYLLTRAELLDAYELYVPDAGRRREPYASPLFARNLAGLPPTTVITAQFDPLRDEGEEYARRLAAAGVPTQHVRARGHVHSSTYTAMRSARRYQRLAADALRRAYGTATG